MDYPRMVYKCPGPFKHNGGSHDYALVEDDKEHKERLLSGWFDTMPEAINGKTEVEAEQEVEKDSEPTREELEEKAKELGISFDGRTSDAKLLSKINEAIQG